MYVNFDSQTVSLPVDGVYTELSFQEALEQKKVTQAQLDASRTVMLDLVLRDLEAQGFKNMTNSLTSDCFCIFEDKNGNRYECKNEADVCKLEELGYLP